MQAGKLRHKMTVEQLDEVYVDDGRTKNTWSFFANAWASVQPFAGRELLEAEQMSPRVDHRVALRDLPGLRPGVFRFLLNGRVLSIVSVRNIDERSIAMECLCREEP